MNNVFFLICFVILIFLSDSKLKNHRKNHRKKNDLDHNQNHRQVYFNRDLNHFRFKKSFSI
jgi:hypothetical protein